MRVHHVALRVRSVEQALAFYGGVLGLPERRRFVEPEESGPATSSADFALRSVWLDAGGVVLMLERALRGQGAAEGTGHVLVLEVDDLRVWELRLEAAGCTIDDRTDFTLYTRDPEGHRVGLSVYRFAWDSTEAPRSLPFRRIEDDA